MLEIHARMQNAVLPNFLFNSFICYDILTYNMSVDKHELT